MGKRSFLRLTEKGGKFHEIPVHHVAQEYVDHYIDFGRVEEGWLFRTSRGRSDELTKNKLSPRNALHMIKRCSERAGISDLITCHTFRATGITTYLKNGGSIENAQYIAAHESPRTTKLYDRRMEEVSLDEIERIII
jgi:integrase